MYSAMYGEVNVSVEKCVEIKGEYVEKQHFFYFCHFKKFVSRKLSDPTTYVSDLVFYHCDEYTDF